jgi:hypothetical protein
VRGACAQNGGERGRSKTGAINVTRRARRFANWTGFSATSSSKSLHDTAQMRPPSRIASAYPIARCIHITLRYLVLSLSCFLLASIFLRSSQDWTQLGRK